MQTIVTCPKCSSEMITVRRSGVMIERCSGCDGVFLDRGELEKLIALEQQSRREPQRDWDDDLDADDDYYEESGRGRRKKSRKRSFFEELFDID